MKSDLFIECAKNVVDFYNLTQESIGSKNRMEYPVIKEVKPREWVVTIIDDKLYRVGTFASSPDSKLETIKVREVIE